jgi:rhodanese-related sulfurtransferase
MEHFTPRQAHAFLQAHPDAVLVDIRYPDELAATGTPDGALHVPFADIFGEQNPHFVEQFTRAVPHDRPVLLICRSGRRTLDAGEVLEALGYARVINVLHGVEGDADARGERQRLNGWLFDGLPVRHVHAPQPAPAAG